jgi:hypothetical protein
MQLRVRLFAAAALMGLVSACAPTLGPAPPPGMTPAPDAPFSAAAFAWSQVPGKNSIVGKLVVGPVRYTCAGASVVLTPETPWSRRRMQVLYMSDQRSALLADEVRARTPQAAPGDSGPYIKRAVCDPNDHFSFSALPDGAWYVITIAKPVGQPNGPSMALMRRVTTRGGKITPVEL